MIRKKLLRNYAALIAKCGVNIQKGQEVFISASVEQPEFVKLLVQECYKLKASKVVVDWSYQPLQKINIKYRSLHNLSILDDYEEARWKHYAEKIPCRIFLESDDPDGLNGIDQYKLSKSNQSKFKLIKKYRDQIENKYQWCIAAVPGKAWARKLFPDLTSARAIEKLWNEILLCSRAYGNPFDSWKMHNNNLHNRCEYLNSLGLKELHYYADNGTDITIGLIPQGEFKGGSEKTLQGIEINPNIPSEECYISPMKGKAEGVVYSTMPLSYHGQLIENFYIKFENGKAVAWNAEKNNDLLGQMISMDDGSAYLGECALVPVDSPISKSGILFFNTLFDENASCHLALGLGFQDTIHDYEKYSLNECRKMGINDSIIHEDFMIGYEGLNIDGITTNDSIIPIFRNGNWAFDI